MPEFDDDYTAEDPDGDPRWYLEGYVDERRVLRRLPLKPIPYRVGRKADLPLSLNFANISRVHAELYFTDTSGLMVRDLESRNGTFINRERIRKPAPLRSGDVLHFGNAEFRVGYDDSQEHSDFGDTCEFHGVLPAQFETGTREFMEMVRSQSVESFFQPLVRLEDRALFGYEALGRGRAEGVPEGPSDLFRIAAACGLEEELSRLFRAKAMDSAGRLPGTPVIFFNIHPAEMRTPEHLLAHLADFRRQHPKLRMTLEVHESLVTDLSSMRDLLQELRNLKIGLAYDDFGAGQARLVELAEAPPDYLKFDRSLVAGLHAAPRQRQQMVEVLVKFAREIGVTTLAEGIELEEEADICQQLGFDTAQGYYFGRPASADDANNPPA